MNQSFVFRTLQTQDPDRFLLSMLARAEHREDLWALIAFNHEIAKTRDVVSEKQLGLIRLKWWQEAVGAVYAGGPVPAHEVMEPLAALIRLKNLPPALFEALIDARALEMTADDFPTLDAFLTYAAATSEPLLRLMLLARDINPESEAVYALALNYALVGLIRAMPHAAAHGVCLIPADLLALYGLERTQVMSGHAPSAALSKAVQHMLSVFEAQVKPDNTMLRGMQALSLIYRRRIRVCGYNPFHPALSRPPAMKVLRVLIKSYIYQ